MNDYRRVQKAKERLEMEEKAREEGIASKIVKNLKSRLDEGLAAPGGESELQKS